MSELSTESPAQSAKPTIFFDGVSSRRRQVTLALGDALEIVEEGAAPVRWAYADIRRADSPAGILRLSCTTAPPLARLEVRDVALATQVMVRCARLDEHQTSRRGLAKIVGWSVAAAVSIVCVVLFGVPLAADRLAPLVPKPIERRIGDASEVQVKTIFGRSVCEDPAGKAAFTKLVNRLRDAAGLDDDAMVCDLAGKPYPELIVTDANQEHGIIGLRKGSNAALPDLPIGSRVRILTNHACATGAQYDRYQVLDGEGGVSVVWPRINGW